MSSNVGSGGRGPAFNTGPVDRLVSAILASNRRSLNVVGGLLRQIERRLVMVGGFVQRAIEPITLTMRRFVDSVVTPITASISASAYSVVSSFVGGVGHLAGILSGFVPYFGELAFLGMIFRLLLGLREIVRRIRDDVRDFVVGLRSLFTWLRRAWGRLLSLGSRFVARVSGVEAIAGLRGFLGRWFRSLWSALRNVVFGNRVLSTLFMRLPMALGGVVGLAVASALFIPKERWRRAFEDLERTGRAVSSALGFFGVRLMDYADRVGGLVGSLARVVGVFVMGVGVLSYTVERVVGAVYGKLADLAGWIRERLSGVVDSLASFVDGIKGELGRFANVLFGVDVGRRGLPELRGVVVDVTGALRAYMEAYGVTQRGRPVVGAGEYAYWQAMAYRWEGMRQRVDVNITVSRRDEDTDVDYTVDVYNTSG